MGSDADTCILQSVLPALVKRGLSPNLQTFCNLAIACHKEQDGLQLLSDLKVIKEKSAAWGLSCRKRQSEGLMLLKDLLRFFVVSGSVLSPKICSSRVVGAQVVCPAPVLALHKLHHRSHGGSCSPCVKSASLPFPSASPALVSR